MLFASAVPLRLTVLLALTVSVPITGAAGTVVSICRVPAGLGHRAGEIGHIAGTVGDACRIEIDRGHRQVGGVLSGSHGIAEGQRIAARAAAIGRSTAVVECQRRAAARYRHRLAQVDRQGDGLAGIQIAACRC